MTILDKNKLIAQKALSAFLKQPDDLIFCEPLMGGSEEAGIIKCSYLATNYVVKLFSSSEFGRNEIAWTKLASQLGIGSKFYYADPGSSYMITKFAKGNLLVPSIANAPAIIKAIATSLAKLHHATAPFARVSHIGDRIEFKYRKLRTSGAPKMIIDTSFEHAEELDRRIIRKRVEMTPCHNDLNPGNIFVADDGVTLIDWGDAAAGNPYYDIAAFFVLNVIEPKGERLFFEQYDAKLLSPQWQKEMRLYKQLVYFEFALNLLLGVQAQKSELLHADHVPQVKNISYYLTLLAEREVQIDADFLYHMALASFNEMDSSKL